MALSSRPFASVLTLVILVLTSLQPARGQEATRSSVPFRSVDDLNVHHDRQLADVERRRLADLDALASSKSGAEGESAYRELFLRAIALDMMSETAPAAERYLSSSGTVADVRALATLVASVADSEHGKMEKAFGRFRTLVADRRRAGSIDPEPLLGVGEAFLRRLIRMARYDEARQFCSLLADESGEAEVSAHFKASLKPLKLVGRPAPAIDMADVDNHRFRLADLKGKVVLVSFWASWCPPCLDAFPGLNALDRKYREKGLEILGVNLDAHHEDVKDVKSAMPIVRHVLVHNGVMWPNVLNDDGMDADIARSYGVDSVPSYALIGRDGTILAASMGVADLEAAIRKALAEGGQSR